MDLSIHESEWELRNSMEEMEKFTCIDGNGKEITLTKEDFLESKKDAKIHDLKFNTNATTFFKDAMKRFVKSK